jgi:hypothetical protein
VLSGPAPRKVDEPSIASTRSTHALVRANAEITLRGSSDDARAAEAGRMICSGRLDAADSEIEPQFVN